ncbi:hypothetical protein [Terrabacter sp. NPDC080008]|uniref:sunset domain-containing protein n=1 Tax=Terrabacter sp. NPDC080008 TaxID=3155176 RepID=UPI00344CE56B
MSDAGKTALWIVVAVAVVAVIIWLFVSTGRRRAAEARRFEASEQRGRVARRADLPPEPRVRNTAPAAAAPAAPTPVRPATPTAPDAPSAAGAREGREARDARDVHDSRVLWDVPEVRDAPTAVPVVEEQTPERPQERTPEQEAEQRRLAETVGAAGALGGAGVLGAPGVGAAAVVAASFTHEDDEDEDDLADAENPFAAPGTTAVGTGNATTHPEERSTTVTEHPAPETADAETADTESADITAADNATTDDATTDTEGAAGVDAGRTTDSAPTSGTATPSAEGSVKPPVATIDEPHQVEVPALADRDDVIAEGGTPAGDPGDHRGQPWATTPGQHGPGDSEEPADEGLDVDMAPHSHASDDVDETAEAVEPGGDAPRREEAEPASDAAAAAFPDEDDTTSSHETAGESDSAGRQEAGSRRTSSFDEVVDGGFGLGSAAPIADGAQPMGHAVKATRDSRTFVAPGDAGYDDVEPDVWFYNEDAARRAGFNRQGE